MIVMKPIMPSLTTKQQQLIHNDYGFKNSILIVNFNYAQHVIHKDYLKELYNSHFKKIIFYSDVGNGLQDEEVNYIYTCRGQLTQGIFKHFYHKYYNDVDSSDGIFYTMDDNILNLNTLNLYRNDKVICFLSSNLGELIDLNSLINSCWFKDTEFGVEAILSLFHNQEYIQKFKWKDGIHSLSDYFFIPRKHFNQDFVDAMDIFAKMKVFLEIAIPTIISHLIPNKNDYQLFGHATYLWNKLRQNLTNFSYIKNSFNQTHTFALHPLKFNSASTDYQHVPETKQWLRDIFCKKKCVVITTINSPSETILKHVLNEEYDTIIVADENTPSGEYRDLNCIYLDIDSQYRLFPELSKLIPFNHYCRKNLGYLYAIQKGYEVIYETDDDNIPNNDFDKCLINKSENALLVKQINSQWINIFNLFFGDTINLWLKGLPLSEAQRQNNSIWPRGLPLSQAYKSTEFAVEYTNTQPSIINGLIENEPDVDAIYRLTHAHKNIHWSHCQDIVVDNKNICPFNTQNTFWIDKDIFACLLIPSSVSFRYCDILRGVITNIILKKLNKNLMFVAPNVVQNRNNHDTFKDLESEIEMYKHNEYIADIIEENTEGLISTRDLLKQIYKNLLNQNIIKQLDIDILNIWLEYFVK